MTIKPNEWQLVQKRQLLRGNEFFGCNLMFELIILMSKTKLRIKLINFIFPQGIVWKSLKPIVKYYAGFECLERSSKISLNLIGAFNSYIQYLGYIFIPENSKQNLKTKYFFLL
jgi:hypothetical protein